MKQKLLILLFMISPFISYSEMSRDQEKMISAQIDKLIDDALQKKNIKPNAAISDEAFLRRIYLDVAGRIPSLEEYELFMSSKDPERRDKEIDKLFAGKAYISHNYNYWADALRAKLTRGKTHLDGYQLWIKQSVAANMPYNQFVKELITAEGLLFKPGNGKVGYYVRDSQMLEDNLSNTMQLFLATSVVCAQCHDHPYNRYTQMDYYKLFAFINGTKLNYKSALSLSPVDEKGRAIPGHKLKQMKKDEYGMDLATMGKGSGAAREKRKIQRSTFISMNHNGLGKIKLPDTYSYEDGKPGQEIIAGVPYGPSVKINYESDNGASKPFYVYKNDEKTPYDKDVNSRKYFAEWITSDENPMFAKTIVNRLWSRLWGTPLVGNLLDMKESSMGTNPELTSFLISVMQKNNYDMKLFMKVVVKSKAYQRAATQEEVSYKTYNFQGPLVNRLSAYQVYDSLLTARVSSPDESVTVPDYTENTAINNYVTGKDLEVFKKLHHDPDKYKPLVFKELKDKGKVIFKYAGRGSGRASELSGTGPGSLIQIFGGSTREIIDEAIEEANIPQSLYLMNDPEYAFAKTVLAKKLQKVKSSEEKIKLLYAAVLSRQPGANEISRLNKYLAAGMSFDSVFWALINSHEFLLRM